MGDRFVGGQSLVYGREDSIRCKEDLVYEEARMEKRTQSWSGWDPSWPCDSSSSVIQRHIEFRGQ